MTTGDFKQPPHKSAVNGACEYTYTVFTCSPRTVYFPQQNGIGTNLKLEIGQVPGRFWDGFQEVSSRVPS